MSYLVQQAQPPLEFVTPALNLSVVRIVQLALPAWLRWRGGIHQIQADHVEILVDLYQQFQDRQIRFLMAFRHPSIWDPACLLYLLGHVVPKTARQQSRSLQQPIHAHFIYDRGIPLWAGAAVGWLFTHLGATSIQRGRVDRQGLRSARQMFVDGPMPMAAAPEGGTNGHSEIVSPLEPGIAQMGFWCVEDLIKADRQEQVWIVPIGVQYGYIKPPWLALEKLLQSLETKVGIDLSGSDAVNLQEASLYRRLIQLSERVLAVMEQFYARFYPQIPLINSPGPDAAAPAGTGSAPIAVRLEALLNQGLRVAEHYLDLYPKGSLIDRCRRIEQAGWDRIYREDLKDLDEISPLQRGLADRVAAEASVALWHMRLVESFVAVTGRYVQEKPTAERFAETLLLLRDLMEKIEEVRTPKRPILGPQQVHLTVGQPISVSDRWEQYQASRRQAKQAVADLTQDLQGALEGLVR